MKPYARYTTPSPWPTCAKFTLKPFLDAGSGAPPTCTKNHMVPGFLFSNGGFSGNLYHDYTDVLVSLFISTRQFDGDVQFLLSGLKSWWVSKFSLLFRQLTKYGNTSVPPRCHRCRMESSEATARYGSASMQRPLRRHLHLHATACAASSTPMAVPLHLRPHVAHVRRPPPPQQQPPFSAISAPTGSTL